MRIDDVRRIDLGTFVRPVEETGTGQPRVEAVYGYLVATPHGLVLLDTGLGDAGEETDEWYRPRRVPLLDALSTAGVGVEGRRDGRQLSPSFRPRRGKPALRRASDRVPTTRTRDRSRGGVHRR